MRRPGGEASPCLVSFGEAHWDAPGGDDAREDGGRRSREKELSIGTVDVETCPVQRLEGSGTVQKPHAFFKQYGASRLSNKDFEVFWFLAQSGLWGRQELRSLDVLGWMTRRSQKEQVHALNVDVDLHLAGHFENVDASAGHQTDQKNLCCKGLRCLPRAEVREDFPSDLGL